MLFQTAKAFIMVSDILQQGLAASATRSFEVGGEVRRQLDLAVVLECTIQQRQYVFESRLFLCLLKVKVLHQLPCSSLQRSQQVQDALILAVRQLHLLCVDGDPFAPFFVSSKSSIEDGDVAIPRALLVQGCRRSTTCSCRHVILRKVQVEVKHCKGPGRREALLEYR